MCSFLPLSPKLLAQQKVMIRTAADVDCSPKRSLQHQRPQSLSLLFLLFSKTFECRDSSRGGWLNTGCLFSGWQQKSLSPSERSKGRSCSPAQPLSPRGNEKLCSSALWQPVWMELVTPWWSTLWISMHRSVSLEESCCWRNHTQTDTSLDAFWCCLSFLPAIPTPTRLEGEIELWARSWLLSPRTIHIFALKKCKWKPNLSLLFTCL